MAQSAVVRDYRGAGGRTAAGEPTRANRLGMRSLPRPSPILPSGAVFPPGAAAARAGSKSSLKSRQKESAKGAEVGRRARAERKS